MDCGWPGKRDAERIAAAAKAAGLKQIDHYLTSHYHIDHWGCVGGAQRADPDREVLPPRVPRGAKDVDPKLKEAFLKASEGKQVLVEAGARCPLRGAQVKIPRGQRPGAGRARRGAAGAQVRGEPEHPAKPRTRRTTPGASASC
jgi:beta-lactamase superfamily II metal-dependent hydrolase